MRFAEPFKISDNLSDSEKLEAERLMFLELTQGTSSRLVPLASTQHPALDSVPVGQLYRSIALDQHDRRSDQGTPINWR